jgi:hypothetical protein
MGHITQSGMKRKLRGWKVMDISRRLKFGAHKLLTDSKMQIFLSLTNDRVG